MTIKVGLTGLKGSGKDTAAKVLKAAGFEEVKMAAGLKGMIRSFLYYQGVDSLVVERMIEGDLKEIETEYLGGKSPRQFMQLLGTEFGRDLIHEDLWVNAWKRRVAGLDKTVTTDIRFPNEAQALSEAGGKLYRIERDTDVNIYSLHESEKHIPYLKVSAIIDNFGTVEQLHQEMIYRFLGDKSANEVLDIKSKMQSEVTIRYTLTIDGRAIAEHFDTFHEKGSITPAEMLKEELEFARSIDSTPLAQSILEDNFRIEGQVL
jgi:hypothetical protein